MKTVAIIAEYNPFHNGHAYQLNTIQQKFCATTTNEREEVIRLVIQSGPFVQRGTPALLDPFDRAAMAVLGGADVVVELPTLFATGSAEIFAAGGVRLAHGLGAQYLAFGTEPLTTTASSISKFLLQLARYTTTEPYKEAVRTYLDQKVFYGSALTKALTDAYPQAIELLNKPNALLGLEYCKAISHYAPMIKPITIERYSQYNSKSLQPALPSATAIRAALASAGNGAAPDTTRNRVLAAMPSIIQPLFNDILAKGALADEQRFYDFVLLESRLTSRLDLEELADFGEGLASLWQQAATMPTWDSLVKTVKSKRYSYARLQRMAAYVLLHLKANLRREAHVTGPTYARLLAFNDKGRQWLKATEKARTIPIITKWASFRKHPERFVGDTNRPLVAQSIAIDARASSIQRLCFINPAYRNGDSYLLNSPRYIK